MDTEPWDDRLWQESLPVSVNLHFRTRGITGTQSQPHIRKPHVAVELDPAKLSMKSSPFCWAGHTAPFLGEPYRGHHCSVPPSFRAGSEPQEKLVASEWYSVVSIVSRSKTANGRSLLILGQVFSSFCALPVFTVLKTEQRGKAIYFIYINWRELSTYLVIEFANGQKMRLDPVA